MALRGRTILGVAGLSATLLAGALPAHALPKHLAPVPAATVALMASRGMAPSAPVLLRAYKQESEIEVWKRAADGRFVHLKTFPICRWSGQLGPKTRAGDRQAPEGFYSVAARQLNPNSAYFLSFDVGYPNAYDRAHGGTGSALMVHGTCSSAGCFAMTDRQVGEIYALVRDALAGGQAAFQFQAFPFRMTARAMARHRTDRHIAFWRQLKEGSDRFEATGREPLVGVQGGAYVFSPYPDPAVEALAAARRTEEEARIQALVEGGVEAVRTTYADGGQHPSFTALLKRASAFNAAAVTGATAPVTNATAYAPEGAPAASPFSAFIVPAGLGDVSRPEALAMAGREVVVIPARRRPPAPLHPIQVAAAFAPLPVIETEPSPFSRLRLAEEPSRLTLAASPEPARPRFLTAKFAALP
ncbi:murein L,D-transpeptidase family protein [Methylobacterium sp. 17Sr1-1]|uniref:L,D-transpeptidase family protein n=1 Tax=Methylobacterium sp. 17Sr1-1 TaxID=2202826 RepID=UPI001FE0E12A|nr:murein L,D-transpeptidase family protein [Methylobacterium sp. 17Sr1-1]